ncbi:MAG TPA: hypothetical protein VF868_05890 [Bacteroidia bacterium]|jgi:hypothetical protein
MATIIIMHSKHKHIPFIIFVSFITLLGACSEKNIASGGEVKEEVQPRGAVAATVFRLDLDGCTWMIRLEDGTQLQPSGLQLEFQQDGLKVWVTYTNNKHGTSICMAGQVIDVTEIQLRK